jgi:hypothetical protein
MKVPPMSTPTFQSSPPTHFVAVPLVALVMPIPFAVLAQSWHGLAAKVQDRNGSRS